MATKLLYLDDFDVLDCNATIVKIQKTDDDRMTIILDQTCFYPRGGGQDWDIGKIGKVFDVQEVRLDENGFVNHIGNFTGQPLGVGDTVECVVNTENRAVNTRLHSAGHVVDMVMTNLRPDWTPGRGAHYPHMSFVEYQVPAETQLEDTFKQELENKIAEQLKSRYLNQIRFMEPAEMRTYCRHVPENIPTNKPSRIVLYADDFGIPCGGTHVKAVSDIGKIQITKIKVKKDLAKVSYAVDGIN